MSFVIRWFLILCTGQMKSFPAISALSSMRSCRPACARPPVKSVSLATRRFTRRTALLRRANEARILFDGSVITRARASIIRLRFTKSARARPTRLNPNDPTTCLYRRHNHTRWQCNRGLIDALRWMARRQRSKATSCHAPSTAITLLSKVEAATFENGRPLVVHHCRTQCGSLAHRAR